jgi:D-alanyl-D-alanine carboxypeptidase/D-alanyl-D-alanine-endopeptidase (penicillin-binding protein 4)
MKPILRLALFSVSVGGCAAFHPSTTSGPSGARAPLARSIDSMIGSRDFRSANWGILIVDPERGDTLYSHNATKLFIPASNQKLVTTSVMLERLGPDFRYKTYVVAQGRVADGTLDGNLAVIGRGDPTASNHMKGDAMLPLRAMAESLWQRGIRHVSGDVIAFGNAMPGPVAGAGWPWDGLDGNSYAGVDELLFNEGLTTVRVRSGSGVGSPAVVETGPAKTFPLIHVAAMTVAADTSQPASRGGRGGGRGSRGGAGTRLSIHNDTGSASLTLRGQIVLGDSATLSIAQHDPDAAYVAALTEALRDRGIVVEHGKPEVYVSRTDTLFTVQSVPLREILPAIMKPSQNQIAEIFLRTIGLEGTGVGTADSGRRVIERQFADWNIASDGFVVRDGSGLSRSDLVSPETIVRILDHMRRSPNFQFFYDALPIAGVDGTIGTRMRNTPAQGNLHAKTGTLQMVRSLSGYVTTADKRLLEFSILCNNWTTPQADVDRVGDAVGAMLAGLKGR